MKPISRELSKAISKDFEEISTTEHNESEMYLADIAEVLIGFGSITPERVSSILKIIRKYGELKRWEGETAATLKIVDAACGRLPV
jgi:histidinol phosphatase-like PHP family hydrolase